MMLGRSLSNRGGRGNASNSRGTSPRGRGRGASNSSGPTTSTNPANPFEAERLEYAAKREQRSLDRGGTNGRAGRGGSNRGTNGVKQVRFASPPSRSEESVKTSDLGQTKSVFGASNSNGVSSNGPTPLSNPFAAVPNPFSASTSKPNPFNASVSNSNHNPFSATVESSANGSSIPNPFKASTAASNSSTNPFKSANSTHINSKPFGSSTEAVSRPTPLPNPFASKEPEVTKQLHPFAQSKPSSWLQQGAVTHVPDPTIKSTNKFNQEIEDVLRKNGISAPAWPSSLGTLSLDRVRNGKVDIEGLFKAYKTYRAKARSCLIRTGYIDDPDKPKKLSEAIDFKGICEDMCPEFEKISRIMDHDVREAELIVPAPGDDFKSSTRHMVKALARSAAGQDAPLPQDIRSPSALRRTVDYLIDTVLGEHDIASVHGFLWDRTRAIRRDFVFQQSSMTPDELLDHVYCLETIVRFHIVALHQMSSQDIVAEDFSEQQEVEQLGKALLSLIHAYEDCETQNIHCDNEAEFRAYYVVFNVDNPAILEAVQDWGWKYWGQSDDIRTAVSLVECLHNIWDAQGPLRPHAATDIAPNMFNRFFTIVENQKISYTMACFAELHFNRVRKAALKTILIAYRKQRDQTKDWNLHKLNQYLRFDHEEEVVGFGEAFGLHFEVSDDELYLSISSDDTMTDPLPQIKHPHSLNLVERKRGQRTLPQAIHQTIFEDSQTDQLDGGSSLFVPESASWISESARDNLIEPVSQEPSFDSPTKGGFLQAQTQNPTSTPTFDFTKPFGFPTQSQPAFSNGGTASAQSSPVPGLNPDLPVTKATENFQHLEGEVKADNPFEKLGQNTGSSLTNTTTLFPSPLQGSTTTSPFSVFGQSKKSDPIIERNSSNSTSPFTFLTPKPNTTHAEVVPAQLGTLPSNDSATKSIFHPSETQNPSNNVAFDQAKPIFSPPISHSTSTATVDQSKKERTGQAGLAFATPESFTTEQPLPQQSSKAPLFQAINSGVNPFSPKKQTPSTPKFGLGEFAKWFALADGGVIDQFTEVVVHKALSLAVQQYNEEEDRRIAAEEEAAIALKITRFRYRSLATKYGHLWRRNARRKWMKRKGREARAARRQMAEDMRASDTARSAGLVDDFRRSRQDDARKSLEDSILKTRMLDGIHQPDTSAKTIVNGTASSSEKARRTSSDTKRGASTTKTSPPGQHKDTSQNYHRRSLSTDLSMGGSRIHLLPDYNPQYERRRQISGVKTDYFRLKARGITTLPDGTPLANMAAVHLFPKDQSLNRLSSPHTPQRGIEEHHSQSVPSKLDHNRIHRHNRHAQIGDSTEAFKARASDLVLVEDDKGLNKRLLDDDDEELFAKAKRIREQLDEGAQWYREEIEKESMSRSVS